MYDDAWLNARHELVSAQMQLWVGEKVKVDFYSIFNITRPEDLLSIHFDLQPSPDWVDWLIKCARENPTFTVTTFRMEYLYVEFESKGLWVSTLNVRKQVLNDPESS
jgi:hypothetical protein